MSRRRFPLILVAVTVLAALLLIVAGCGDGGDQQSETAATGQTSTATGPQKKAEGGGKKAESEEGEEGHPTKNEPGDGGCETLADCYSPQQVQTAYGVTPLLKQGIDGRGQTVVLPELAEPQFPLPSSDIRRDLAQFDRLFHLPAARVRVDSKLAPKASPWMANGEEVLDTEMVHAIAPGAEIVEVLVKGTAFKNTSTAVAAAISSLRLGATLGGVISISAAGQAGGEGCDSPAEVAELHEALENAESRNVTVVAASGDIGVVGEPCQVYKGLIGGAFSPSKEANLPAADPLVLGAGGTALTAERSGAYVSESAWGLEYGDPGTHFQASGGGLSDVYTQPSYQSGIAAVGTHRGVPDVAATASPHTALAVITHEPGGGYSVHGSGGTSSAAPVWAGIMALADQSAGRDLGFVNPALYRIAAGPEYHQAFHDVITGNNSVRFSRKTIQGYQAAPGWDAATGLGSPNAAVLVPLLDHEAP